jgi:hypothetical protein
MKYFIYLSLLLGSAPASAHPAIRVVTRLLKPSKIHVDKAHEDPKSKEFKEREAKERYKQSSAHKDHEKAKKK